MSRAVQLPLLWTFLACSRAKFTLKVETRQSIRNTRVPTVTVCSDKESQTLKEYMKSNCIFWVNDQLDAKLCYIIRLLL